MDILPSVYTPYIVLVLTAFGLFFLGFFVVRVKGALSQIAGFLLMILAVTTAHFIFEGEPPFFRMLAIIWLLFLAMKVIVWNAYRSRSPYSKPNIAQWTQFALLWVGMHPRVFLVKTSPFRKEGKQLMGQGITHLLLGSLLIVCSIALKKFWMMPYSLLELVLITAFLLTGISLCLHFGILNINASIWRFAGYKTYAVFRNPIASKTLQEFWGRRWNLAFSEMTALAIYRPLKDRFSPGWAKTAAFLFSGLLHECAISLPVQAGYGLPMLYFLLHAIAQRLEEKFTFENAFIQKIWILAWLTIPILFLFHPYFLRKVIWPLIGLEIH